VAREPWKELVDFDDNPHHVMLDCLSIVVLCYISVISPRGVNVF